MKKMIHKKHKKHKPSVLFRRAKPFENWEKTWRGILEDQVENHKIQNLYDSAYHKKGDQVIPARSIMIYLIEVFFNDRCAPVDLLQSLFQHCNVKSNQKVLLEDGAFDLHTLTDAQLVSVYETAPSFYSFSQQKNKD